jgi:hypothetical protein
MKLPVVLQPILAQRNLYDILKVSHDATDADIQQASEQLITLYQGQMEQNPQAKIWLDEVQEAYKILSSPYRRNAYDISLEEKHLETQVNMGILDKLEQVKRIGKKTLEQMLNHLSDKAELLKASLPKNDTPNKHIIEEKKSVIQQETPALDESNSANVRMIILPIPLVQTKKDGLLPDEKLLKRAYIHPLFIFDLWGLFLTLISGYFLYTDSYGLHQTSPTVNVIFSDSMNQFLPMSWITFLNPISIWTLGIILLLMIGVLILLEGIFTQLSTQFLITSRRLILRRGIFWRTEIELKMPHLDSITIQSSILGRVLNYGEFVVIGMGGTKLYFPHLMTPQKIRQLLWEMLAVAEQKSTF